MNYTFHQPKRPPIPEDGLIVLADYMLYADFKPQTTAGTTGLISKGARTTNFSRDVFLMRQMIIL